MRLFCLFLLTLSGISALENGLARKPPMGWMSWAAFYCEINCTAHPKGCINENLYMEMADHLVSDGFRDAGYVTIHIDDCWMETARQPDGVLLPNRTRFPSGIRKLSEYMHARNLQLGIYQDAGSGTCEGYPGSLGYSEIDAKTFAEWDVDYVKYDGCNLDKKLIPEGYKNMTAALNRTGHPMVYSCEWPLYLKDDQSKIDYKAVADTCNLWRSFDDVASSWASILSIIDFYVAQQDRLIEVQGPGAWNDPDMLVIGNGGVSLEMAKSQMIVWSMWSAPLIISTDLRVLDLKFREIALHKDVIALDQDPLGRMARMIRGTPNFNVFLKPISPVDPQTNETAYAIAVLNRNPETSTFLKFQLSDFGFCSTDEDTEDPVLFEITNVWTGERLGVASPITLLRLRIKPASTIVLRAVPVKRSQNNLVIHVSRAEIHVKEF